MKEKSKEKVFNELAQDTFFEYKCTSCKENSYRTIVFYKSVCYAIEFFRLCKECFLNLTAEDVQDIYSQIGQENKYLTSTCSFCYRSCTKYLFVEKGLGRKLCVNCLTEMIANDSEEDSNECYVVIENEQNISDIEMEKTLKYIHEQFLVHPYETGKYRNWMDEYGYFLVSYGTEDVCREIINILEGKDIEVSTMTKEEFDKISEWYFVIITNKQNKTDEEIEEILNRVQNEFEIELTEKGGFRQEIDDCGFFFFGCFPNCEVAEDCWSILKSLDIKSKILNEEEWEELQEDK